MAHRVLFLPGDGVGPELLAAAQVVLRATGVRLKVESMDYGRSYERTHGRVWLVGLSLAVSLKALQVVLCHYVQDLSKPG
jgi:isocitrate/isopropylmalate dehydrogenase